ncbi:MAG TPA: MFS transporter [Candidatus Limnocylindrales bacterium]|nr:MFS transporter [Candidatus Limnocylindrales bacterium]
MFENMEPDMHHTNPTTASAAAGLDARRWWILAVLAITQLMLIVDVTVTNVALPSIAAELGLDRSSLTWVATAYTLLFGSLLLLGGRLADAFGRRRTFLVGLTTFVAASLASGLAPDGLTLVVARAAQGVGAALMSPAALSIITTTFAGAERNRALGIWAAVGGSGAAIGVVLGGLLVSGPGWEWVFFINVPIGLAVLVAVGRTVRADPRREGPIAIDVPGAILATTAIALLLYGLISAGDGGWTSAATLGPIALGLLAGAAFWWLQARSAEPLVRPALLGRTLIGGPLVVMIAAAGMLASSFFLVSIYLQRIAGLSAFETGLAFLPGAAAIVLTAQAGAHAMGRFGARPVAAAGLLVAAAGAITLTGLPAQPDVALDVLPGMILLSAGIGPAFVAATTGAFARVGHHDAGTTSGLVNTGHELGFSLGVALVSAIAGASLGGDPSLVGGFGSAFLATAAIGGLAAAGSMILLPEGRPAIEGHAFAH